MHAYVRGLKYLFAALPTLAIYESLLFTYVGKLGWLVFGALVVFHCLINQINICIAQ